MITQPDWNKAPKEATEFYPETSNRWAAYARWENGIRYVWVIVSGNIPSCSHEDMNPQLRHKSEAIERPTHFEEKYKVGYVLEAVTGKGRVPKGKRITIARVENQHLWFDYEGNTDFNMSFVWADKNYKVVYPVDTQPTEPTEPSKFLDWLPL